MIKNATKIVINMVRKELSMSENPFSPDLLFSTHLLDLHNKQDEFQLMVSWALK